MKLLCSPTLLWGTTNRMVCLQPSMLASHVPWVPWIPENMLFVRWEHVAHVIYIYLYRFKIGLHYDYHLICHPVLAIVSHCFFCLNIYNGYSKNLRKSAMFLLEGVASPFSAMDSMVPSCASKGDVNLKLGTLKPEKPTALGVTSGNHGFRWRFGGQN